MQNINSDPPLRAFDDTPYTPGFADEGTARSVDAKTVGMEGPQARALAADLALGCMLVKIGIGLGARPKERQDKIRKNVGHRKRNTSVDCNFAQSKTRTG